MRTNRMRSLGLSLLLGAGLLEGGTLSAWGMNLIGFDGEDYEDPAGALVFLECDPVDMIYGAGYGNQVWLKNAPILGDFFFTFFYNDTEEMLYGGLGMSLRVMPHWRVAPFIGGGGSANLALGTSDSNETFEDEPEPGESYGAGHVEAGVQWERDDGVIEILVRYVTTTSDLDDNDYVLMRLGYGLRF